MMKKGIVFIGMILVFGFAPSDTILGEDPMKSISENEAMLKEIKIMEHIVAEKRIEAGLLETEGLALLEKDNASEKGTILLKEAKLQRMMTLKYKTAIACKTHFLK